MNNKLKQDIGIIRRFNRYYTNVLGLLDQHLLGSEYSLSEVRVLHEIEKTANCTAKKLAEVLSMDAGYLSRILNRFTKCGLVEKMQSLEDRRLQYLGVTPSGKVKMDALNKRSDEQIGSLLQSLPEAEQAKLVRSMAGIEAVLAHGKNIKPEDIVIRHNVKAGDAGYITYLHGWIYKQEYNYSTAFEAYVAKTFFDAWLNFNANRDRLWVAEHQGEIVGCIGIVGRGEKAQLRWFLLQPNYRGIGLGKKLLQAALAFCRQKRYAAVYLTTTDDLATAIGMYTKAGFVKVSERENHSWADQLIELEFELKLQY